MLLHSRAEFSRALSSDLELTTTRRDNQDSHDGEGQEDHRAHQDTHADRHVAHAAEDLTGDRLHRRGAGIVLGQVRQGGPGQDLAPAPDMDVDPNPPTAVVCAPCE